MRRRAACLITGLSLFVASGVPLAAADPRVVRDRKAPSDDRGPLDIDLASHGHRKNDNGRRRFVHTIRLETEWRSPRLRGAANWLAFVIRVPLGDGDYNRRFLWIDYSKRDGLHAHMYEPGNHPTDRSLGPVPVWRVDDEAVRVAIAPRLLKRGSLDAYLWSATSSFESERSKECPPREVPLDFPYGTCTDRVPSGERFIRHDV